MENWFEWSIITIGIIIVIWGLYLFRKAKSSLYWNEILGHIDYISLDVLEMPGDTHKSYKIKIRYSYRYDGRPFVSHKIFIGDFMRSSFPLKARKILKEYKTNDNIIIYFNPKKHSDSIIIKGVDWGIYFLLIMGVVSISIGLILYVFL
ncbi:DUF3592 domain-containing protein [Dysgonomonas capnocytophagoides]|uniref:DUF3592 domain-containing protein n=1 Tax=Dysgonomonas capnocytophagoides TaxID=45254 RepID=UPI0033400B8C